jgi:hypothetical protein
LPPPKHYEPSRVYAGAAPAGKSIMIHIIGTCHKTQVWSELVKKQPLGVVPLAKIKAFQKFVTEAAIRLGAVTIGEEMSEDRMFVYGHNAMSVAQLVARHLKIAHVFCEPNQNERLALGLRVGDEMAQHASEIATRTGRAFPQVHEEEVRKQFLTRETFWATRLAPYNPEGNAVVFICGADHCATLPETLRQKGFKANIQCPDWTLLSEIPCPCCM